MVGVPARVILPKHARFDASLDHANLPDPVAEMIRALAEQNEQLRERVSALEDRLGVMHEERPFVTDNFNVIFEEPAGKFVITPNTPVRQIWISALSTSFKLDWDPATGAFVLPRSGEKLIPLIDRLIEENTSG